MTGVKSATIRGVLLCLVLSTTACRPEGSPPALEPASSIGEIVRLDPLIDAIVPTHAGIEVLAEGFEWSEGPVWVEDGGFLLFSDVPRNAIYRWKAGEGHREWLQPSGHTDGSPERPEPGSNGLVIDAEGSLLMCQHGDRRVARMEAPLSDPAPVFSTLAERFDGRRLNSPNDLVLHSSGAIYFTDPPYGLPLGADDPSRETPFSGVYRRDPEGRVTLLTADLSRPNGIAFSPDESVLYVANSDPERAVWMAFDVLEDGSLARERVFFDATHWVSERAGLPDGLDVDARGNLFASGPGGVLVFTPDGTHLGTIVTTRATANCTLGEEGRALYITADDLLLRVELDTAE